MKRISMVLVLLALMAMLLVGCGSSGGEEAQPAGGEATQPAVEATPTDEPVAPFDIMLAQDGTKLTMSVGQTTTVKLGTFYYWTVTISDTTVLAEKAGVTLNPGEQGVFEALKAGTVTLTAVGNSCETPPCAMPAQNFSVEIEVK